MDIIQVTEASDIRNSFGVFQMRIFRVEVQADIIQPIAAIYQDPLRDGSICRINSACMTSESFGDQQCDCKWQLDETFRLIAEAGHGIIIYIPHHEGRGSGLFHKVRSMHLMQKECIQTDEAFIRLGLSTDARSYDFVKPILSWFGLREISLVTNNPDKIRAQQNIGIHVQSRVPLVTQDPALRNYLMAKRNGLGHMIEFGSEPSIKSEMRITDPPSEPLVSEP